MRGVGRHTGERRVRGHEEELARARPHLRRGLAVLERPIEVVRGDLGHLGLATGCDGLDPGTDLTVQVATLPPWERRVRDVVRQCVLERELAHSRDRRFRVLGDERPPAE